MSRSCKITKGAKVQKGFGQNRFSSKAEEKKIKLHQGATGSVAFIEIGTWSLRELFHLAGAMNAREHVMPVAAGLGPAFPVTAVTVATILLMRRNNTYTYRIQLF